MFRFLLIALMLMQPIQWVGAAIHITSDVAHSVTHKSSGETIQVIEKVAVCSLIGGAADSHSCHDHHNHTTTVLGLCGDIKYDAHFAFSSKFYVFEAAPFASTAGANIERPKWIAAR